jgi:cell shape-determining protein MreC
MALRGRVVVRVEQSETPQLYQTFLIDRGERDGVRMGDIFAAGPAGAPVLRGCVMHVGERSSTLMVMRLSGHRLESGDSVALVKRMDFREER